MWRWLGFVAIVAFSTGWLVPIALASYFFFGWCHNEVEPSIYSREPEMNTFPYLADSEWMFWRGLAWLALVTLFWSVVGAHRLVFAKRPTD